MLKEIYLELQKFELFQKIEQFIQKNKTMLGSFAVCAIVASIGYGVYSFQQNRLNEKSSALFTEAMVSFENNDFDNAKSSLQKLASEGREHYATFSKIMLTALDQEGKEYKESVQQAYDNIANNVRVSREIRDLSLLKGILYAIAHGKKIPDAIAKVEKISSRFGPWQYLSSVILGFVKKEEGSIKNAIDIFKKVDKDSAPTFVKEINRILLNRIKQQNPSLTS